MARMLGKLVRHGLVAGSFLVLLTAFAAEGYTQIEARRFEGGLRAGQIREPVRAPIQRTAETTTPTPVPAFTPPPVADAVAHPLDPVLKMAYGGLEAMDKSVRDYTATLVKRERINGKLGEYKYMFVKIRHKPFSVYLYFLGPEKVRGREVIYVEGQNHGKLVAHEASGISALVPRVKLDPNSDLAMSGEKYPITKIGIRNLTKELVEVGEQDKRHGECEVKFFKGAKVQDRVCTCLQVVHPVPRKHFRFHLARVYIDDEHQVPIRYESYLWPQEAGGTPPLEEEYTYMKLKFNVGLKDSDFDPDNPNYKF